MGFPGADLNIEFDAQALSDGDLLDSYPERCVAATGGEHWLLSTVGTPDSIDQFETALRHKDYNESQWICVATAQSREEAALNHDKWHELVQSNQLPDQIEDVSRSEEAVRADALVGTRWRIKLKEVK